MRVRVALLIPTLRVGGAERNILRLGNVLREVGLDVEVWLTSADERDLVTNLPVVAVGDFARGAQRPLAVIRRVRGIRNEIARFRPECLISFLESSSIPAVVAGMVTFTPTIVSVRGNPKRFNWFYRVMVFAFYRFARSVVAPSAEVAAYLKNRYFLKNTACIPNINTTDARGYEGSLAVKLGGPIVAVGRLVPGKRFDDVLTIASSNPLQRDVVIIGDGPEGNALRLRVSRDVIPATFTGNLPRAEVLELVNGASLLLSMSESECWPNVIAEALALGTPVIARDCDYGPREMITDGANGFLVRSPADVIARGDIRAAFSSLTRYGDLCRSATKSAESWSKDRIRSLWLALIEAATA